MSERPQRHADHLPTPLPPFLAACRGQANGLHPDLDHAPGRALPAGVPRAARQARLPEHGADARAGGRGHAATGAPIRARRRDPVLGHSDAARRAGADSVPPGAGLHHPVAHAGGDDAIVLPPPGRTRRRASPPSPGYAPRCRRTPRSSALPARRSPSSAISSRATARKGFFVAKSFLFSEPAAADRLLESGPTQTRLSHRPGRGRRQGRADFRLLGRVSPTFARHALRAVALVAGRPRACR